MIASAAGDAGPPEVAVSALPSNVASDNAMVVDCRATTEAEERIY